MPNYTTVIRLSEELTPVESSIVEERIGMKESIVSIDLEKGQATVDVEVSGFAEANEIAESLLAYLQEIDPEAEIELVTLNDGSEDEDDGSEEEEEDEDEEEDEWDDFDDETDF
jgi:hypothetical protein